MYVIVLNRARTRISDPVNMHKNYFYKERVEKSGSIYYFTWFWAKSSHISIKDCWKFFLRLITESESFRLCTDDDLLWKFKSFFELSSSLLVYLFLCNFTDLSISDYRFLDGIFFGLSSVSVLVFTLSFCRC